MPRLPIESCTATTVTIDARELLAFGGCNYLGLAHHPAVHAALTGGLAHWGISTTASRETTGNTLAHEALEHELAEFTHQEAAILSAEGYTANFMACQALAGDIGIALIDAGAHRSVKNAAMAAGMQVFEFEHLNPDSAAWMARQFGDAGIAIMTDSVFAADGAIAPLPELLAALPQHLPAPRAALLVDDCHGFCVLGPGGRGAVAHFNLADPRILITTTLAKGLGCYGGTVMGRTPLISRIRDRAWVYRSSTPVPPPIAEACRAALSLLKRDPDRVLTLRRNIGLMRKSLARLNIALPPEGIPIFTFALEPNARMQAVHDMVHSEGILAPLIEYPGGPTPRYFRIVVNAEHTPQDIDRLGETFARALAANPAAPTPSSTPTPIPAAAL